MTAKLLKRFSITFLFLLSFIISSQAFCQSDILKKGVEQYKDESFEEAIETLLKARQEDPGSSTAAFFLGLAYKQTMDYANAYKHIEDAVNLVPRIKEALVELVDICIQLNKLEEAGKWIDVAEKENIAPARIAFLKGMALSKAGQDMEAVTAFEKAKSIDETMKQNADFQIAMSFLKANELKKAKESFQSAILYDPQSDLAGFARQYSDMVETRIFLERPFRFTLGLTGQYDDNMLNKWSDYEPQPWTGGDEKSQVLNTSFRVNYVPKIKEPWLLNAQYAFLSSVHEKNTHTHDLYANSLSLIPGYNFGKYSLNLVLSGSHTMLRSPDYQKYQGTFKTGPLVRMAINDNQMLEMFAGYDWNEYYEPPLITEEDRDSTDLDTYLSWIWLFKKDAFFNLRYQFVDQDADGTYWDNEENRISANMVMPLVEKVKLQMSGEANSQDYKNFNNVFGKTREDTIYNLSTGFTREFPHNITAIAQYSHTRADSNIWAYDYDKNLYSLGLEYRF